MFADITCNDCGGFIKPSVIALGEDIPPLIWNKALNAAKDASLVLAIGSRLSITSAVTLITEARRNGAKIIFINIGDVNIPVYPNDIAIFLPAEKTLPALLVHLR